MLEKINHKSAPKEVVNALVTLYHQGKFDDVLSRSSQLIEEYPHTFVLHNIIGAISFEKGQKEVAIKHFRKVIELRPHHPHAYNNLGAALIDVGEYEEAKSNLKKAIELQPDYAEAYNNLGNVYKEMEEYNQAISVYEKAIELNPEYYEAYNNLGIIYNQNKNFKKALTYVRYAIFLNPDFSDAYNNMGVIKKTRGKFDKAIQFFNKAIKINPNNVMAYCNISNALLSQGKYKESIKYCDKALEINKYNPNAYFHKSLALLSLEKFKEGWLLYESRKKIDPYKKWQLKTLKEEWNKNKDIRLLLWKEAGIGDEILFSSIFQNLEKYCKELIVQTDPRLISLFERSFPKKIKFCSINEKVSEKNYDYHLSTSSLAKFFRNSKNSFSNRSSGWLLPDRIKSKKFRNMINKKEKRLVGISWFTTQNKENSEDHNIELKKLINCLDTKNVEIVNLQYGKVNSDIVEIEKDIGVKIHQLPNLDIWKDIDGLASLIEACDEVISIDNITIHLAGALGKKSKALLKRIPDWKWGNSRKNSFWHSSVELFKKDRSNIFKKS